MVDRYLRPLKVKALTPVARWAVVAHPNLWTAVGAGIGLASAVAAARGAFGWAVVGWWINRIVDGLDGDVARLRDVASLRGAYLDLMADVIVYLAVPLGLAYGASSTGMTDPLLTWLATAALGMAFYLNLASHAFLAQALQRSMGRSMDRGVTRVPHASVARGDPGLHLPAGLVEGAETIVAISVALIVPQWAPWTLGTFALLTTVSAAQRVVWGARHLPRDRTS